MKIKYKITICDHYNNKTVVNNLMEDIDLNMLFSDMIDYLLKKIILKN